MDAEQYRKYEAHEMTEREELIYLKEENQKLREAFNAAKAFIETTGDNPDIYEFYDRYAKAGEVVDNASTESI